MIDLQRFKRNQDALNLFDGRGVKAGESTGWRCTECGERDELREALEGVPRWQEGPTAYKCLGCGGECPLSYDINAYNISHSRPCWVDNVERALANLNKTTG